MADKIPWCKFWHSCLSDPDLEELELHQWARWARLIIFVRGHGDNGKMRLMPPALALQHTLRTQSYNELVDVIKLFRNVSLAPLLQDQLQDTLQAYFLTVKNWYKYQGDDSKERVRKWRVTKSVKSNALDKTRLDVTSKSTSSGLRARSAGATRLPAAPDGKEDKVTTAEMEQAEANERNKEWQRKLPELPESECMTAEEMKAIRIKNLGR